MESMVIIIFTVFHVHSSVVKKKRNILSDICLESEIKYTCLTFCFRLIDVNLQIRQFWRVIKSCPAPRQGDGAIEVRLGLMNISKSKNHRTHLSHGTSDGFFSQKKKLPSASGPSVYINKKTLDWEYCFRKP